MRRRKTRRQNVQLSTFNVQLPKPDVPSTVLWKLKVGRWPLKVLSSSSPLFHPNGSREQALHAAGFGDSGDGDRVRRRAVVAVGFIRLGVDGVEGFFHDLLEFVLDALVVPEVVVQALDPFEV